MRPTISENLIQEAASDSLDAFFTLISDTLLEAIGGDLNAQSMNQLNGEQITLLAYRMLRGEVMDGGFIQLIHNGLGPFIFLNPFAKAMRLWGEALEGPNPLHNFSKLIYKGRKLFEEYGEALTRPCSDEEFMALFEQYPQFDDLDDSFVEAEEDITTAIAIYIDNHLSDFVDVIDHVSQK